jgi:hypothetical protein
VAELLLPRLPLARPARVIEHNATGPFGEMLANGFAPDSLTRNGGQLPTAEPRPLPSRVPHAR